ncbi:MAG TPA: sigma-70 family RNA polymerase sigma factor [Candidatus Dormibacteraeota bacterium]|nr:sigma-70 family RNA polymerase sigma factor [Candidatus Dormibacteraeota bacterium]
MAMVRYRLAVDGTPDDAAADDADLARRITAARPGTAPEAEAELVRRFAPRVRLFGLRQLRDEQAAADLVQQVMLTTLEQLRAGKLREPERVASYVLGVCRTLVRDRRRTHVRQERLLATFAGELLVADPSPAPRLDHARVLACLRGLPERERSVLVLTFFDDCRASEVAAELGISAGNVRVIRHRGLDHLRRCVTGRATAP